MRPCLIVLLAWFLVSCSTPPATSTSEPLNYSCEDGSPRTVLTGWHVRQTRGSTLFLWQNDTLTELSEIVLTENQLQVSERQAIWVRDTYIDGPRIERSLRFWDGETIGDFPYATSGNRVSQPRIDGQNIAWITSKNIHYTDTQSPVQIIETDAPVSFLDLSGNRVVWISGADENAQIYYWDGGDVQQLTDDNHTKRRVHIDGNYVVWESTAGTTRMIQLWDGNRIQTIQSFSIEGITEFDVHVGLPTVSGGRVVWVAYDEYGGDIYHWDGQNIIRITDNQFADTFPQISGDIITWRNREGLYIWQNGITTPLRPYQTGRPAIDNGHIVWRERNSVMLWDGQSIREIHIDDNYKDQFVISAYCP